MTLTVVATMTAKPGSEASLRGTLTGLVELTLAEPGCYGSPHFTEVAGLLDELLAEPLVIKYYNER